MKLLKISFFFACLLFFTLNLSAQHSRGARMNVDSMRVKLGLNAKQEKDIKVIIEHYRPKLKDARSNTDQTARREAMAPLLQAMQEEVRGVLNEEQKVKLDEMKANRPKRGKVEAGEPK